MTMLEYVTLVVNIYCLYFMRIFETFYYKG